MNSLWHSIGSVSAAIAYTGLCVFFVRVAWWAYRPANRKRFEDDANIVLDTDPLYQKRAHDLQEKAQ